jgi:hypothetical protein
VVGTVRCHYLWSVVARCQALLVQLLTLLGNSFQVVNICI